MTNYSTYHQMMRYEPTAFDASKPTSVHRLQQLFEQANHTLDSQLQTRISMSNPAGGGWPVFGTAPDDDDYKLIQTFFVPWRVLTYSSNDEPVPALARPIVYVAGMLLSANENATAVEFGLSMQAMTAAPKFYGRSVIKKWGTITPITSTAQTVAIEAYDDITEAALEANPPQNFTRSQPTYERDDEGTVYPTTVEMTMVRFSLWARVTWDPEELWDIPPAMLSHVTIREGAR